MSSSFSFFFFLSSPNTSLAVSAMSAESISVAAMVFFDLLAPDGDLSKHNRLLDAEFVQDISKMTHDILRDMFALCPRYVRDVLAVSIT